MESNSEIADEPKKNRRNLCNIVRANAEMKKIPAKAPATLE